MLPITKSRSKSVTLVSVFLFIFSVCSWTLAATLVESQTVLIHDMSNTLGQPPKGSNSPDDASLTSGKDFLEPQNGHVNIQVDETPEPLHPDEPLSIAVLGGSNSDKMQVALTFDDGPVPGWTEKYLAQLDETNTPATFFAVGYLADRHGDLISQIASAGHEIGTHSQSHKKLTDLNDVSVRQELLNSLTSIYENYRHSVTYFRPPYGAYNDLVVAEAHKLGQTIVTWNVDPRDWDTQDHQRIVAEVMKQVRPGSIILLHEGKPQTLKALPIIIDRLKQEGYQFTTISGLFGFSPNKDSEPVSTGNNDAATNIADSLAGDHNE